MENAAKALGIAASVMIGVLLLVVLVIAYNQFIQIPRKNELKTKTEQVAEFNKKYDAYNKKNMKYNKLKSLCNMVIDNNEAYADVPEYQIEVYVNFEEGTNSFSINSENGAEKYIIFKNNMDSNPDYETMKKNSTYTWRNAEYNGTNGRISKIIIDGHTND